MAEKTDFDLVQEFFTARGEKFELYENDDDEMAIVFDSHGDNSIGYISHAILFHDDGRYFRMNNWDYDGLHHGYEKIQEKKQGSNFTVTDSNGVKYELKNIVAIESHDEPKNKLHFNNYKTKLTSAEHQNLFTNTFDSLSAAYQLSRKEPYLEVNNHLFPEEWLTKYLHDNEELPRWILHNIVLDWLKRIKD